MGSESRGVTIVEFIDIIVYTTNLHHHRLTQIHGSFLDITLRQWKRRPDFGPVHSTHTMITVVQGRSSSYVNRRTLKITNIGT